MIVGKKIVYLHCWTTAITFLSCYWFLPQHRQLYPVLGWPYFQNWVFTDIDTS